jgi:hypothetical protein
MPSEAILERYAVNHDCGKHLVEVTDGEGRHFPDHANASADYWLEHYPKDTHVALLMRNDMFIHTCTAEELDTSVLSHDVLCTLLLTALAEVHANAAMFGGMDSQSFKIKWKQVNRRGSRLLRHTPLISPEGEI